MAVGGAGGASTAHPLCLRLLNARLGAPGPGTSCLGSRSSQHCKRGTAWPAQLPAHTGFMLTGQHPTPLLRPEYARWAPALPAHACPGSCQRMCTVPPVCNSRQSFVFRPLWAPAPQPVASPAGPPAPGHPRPPAPELLPWVQQPGGKHTPQLQGQLGYGAFPFLTPCPPGATLSIK